MAGPGGSTLRGFYVRTGVPHPAAGRCSWPPWPRSPPWVWLWQIPASWARAFCSGGNYYTGGGWYTGHFWSLAVEEHFYLFFPVLLAWAGPRRTLPLAAALAFALLGWRILDTHST